MTKRDGNRRFCVDFRELNKVTRTDSYPMPHPKDILDRMFGDSYFSFLDGASAYWAIEIAEVDKFKTAFTIPKGLYEFNRMPFGLVNSGSTYQRLMDETLRPVIHADPYVDDICVHSAEFDSHITDLKSTLEALCKANVQLRRDKCSFGYREGEFVGHMITAEGHYPTPRLVEKIKTAERPRTKKELLRFLGLVNYYREHVQGFANIAEPLYRLTHDSAEWSWNETAETAFHSLRSKLIQPPVMLAFPNWNSEFTLQVDASVKAVGGVLTQEGTDGRLKPIAYFSSGLTPAQKKYSAGELECWALIAASRKFRKYLQAAPNIQFLSDHNPLVWLRRQKDPRGKFARWIQELEVLAYEVKYIRGIENGPADFLSRISTDVDWEVNDEDEHFERHIYQVNYGPD